MHRLDRTRPFGELSRERDVLDLLDLRAEQRRLTKADLEAVMIRRIMRSGDHHTAVDILCEHGVIKNGGWHHADQYGVEPAYIAAPRDEVAKSRRALTSVVADGHASNPVLREKSS